MSKKQEHPKLHVNVDHVATLRQARMTFEPSPLEAVKILEATDTAGITMHLREDRRHVVDADIFAVDEYLSSSSKLGLTFEMGATEEIRSLCLKTKAKLATIVPEKREELTTEGGLDLLSQKTYLREFIKAIQNNQTEISFFIDPIKDQIETAKDLGAEFIELHTGTYANSFAADFEGKLGYGKSTETNIDYQELSAKTKNEIARLKDAAKYAQSIGLKVNLGHGLTVDNLPLLLAGHEQAHDGGISGILELHIGHSLVANSIYYGLTGSANKYLEIMNAASSTVCL